MRWTIVQNRDRYGMLRSFEGLPEKFIVEGMTYKEAEELAYNLGGSEAGCDYCFYVEEDEPEEKEVKVSATV